MLDLKVIKAILAFYLDIKRNEWKLVNGDEIVYPAVKTTEREKLNYICQLVSKLEIIASKKKAEQTVKLQELCELLLKQAEKEAGTHKSARLGGLMGHLTNYPAFAKMLHGVASYCRDCAVGEEYAIKLASEFENEIAVLEKAEKEAKTEDKAKAAEALKAKQAEFATYKEINYYELMTGKQDMNAGFVDILKYEDYHYGSRRFQDITSFNDFFMKYTQEKNCFSLLDTLIKIWRDNTFLHSDTSVATVSVLNEGKGKKGKSKAERRANHEVAQALKLEKAIEDANFAPKL